ncbi:hypothetical protein L1987_73716 [Smallanthus sonchifolius]|uniref:Uncharacterized protein n=1 Tax=Smallanthus sonchifolius TaxID=185202 RepID=A0ACB9A047_9ASTR|nr:hypothetical protein L1987_73716 [Smallanthus sonchifolius]
MITPIIFILLCSNIIINPFPASAVSTIKAGDQLNLNSQLVSPGTNFTLGFFTIPNTNYTHLGIWYTIDDDISSKVWVANPSTPITSSSSVLMIDPDTGKLIITTRGTTVVNISDNQSGPNPNLTATLQDTGDFQLKNETDNRILWKSFDYPTNVLLPGMKLGSDLSTGRNWSLTSWLSDEIPDLGAFTLSWEPNGENSQRLMIRRRDQPYWTSGDYLDNQTFEFLSVNNPFSQYWYNLSYVYNNDERYFSYHGINGVKPMWILTANGRVLDGESNALWSPEICYGYDSGNGCVAGSNLPTCRSEDDQFFQRNGEFARDSTESLPLDNSILSFSDCMVRCWNDCSCLGFTTSSNGTGCIRWTGAKSVDNFSVNSQGNSVSKYVLVSPNPGKGNDAKILIWAPVVAGVFLLLFCCGLFWYLKNRKVKQEVTLHSNYMSPEYAMDGTFSMKSDVFSFGVLTLEIVSGRRNTSFSHLDKTVNLIGYAWELWQQGDALQLQDPTLADSCVIHELLRTIHVALLCVQENAGERSVMSEVISMFTNDTMLLPVPKRPAFFFGRAVSGSNLVDRKSEDGSVNNITITQMDAR